MTHEMVKQDAAPLETDGNFAVAVPDQRCESQSPDRIQTACVDLILRLENKLTKLRELHPRGPSTEAVDVGRLILLEIVEFAQQHFSSDEFEQLRPTVVQIHELTGSVAQLLRKSSWSVLRLLKSAEPPENSELAAAYESLRGEYSSFLAAFFVDCVKRFQANDVEKKMFLRTAESLIEELGESW